MCGTLGCAPVVSLLQDQTKQCKNGRNHMLNWYLQLVSWINNSSEQQKHLLVGAVPIPEDKTTSVLAGWVPLAWISPGIVWWTWEAVCQIVRSILSHVCLDTWHPRLYVVPAVKFKCRYVGGQRMKGMSCPFYTCGFVFIFSKHRRV